MRATFLQRVPRGHEDHGQRGGLLEGQAGRNPAHVAAARQRLRGQPKDREAEDAVTRRDMSHARADGLHDAADFVAEDARVRRFAGIERERLEHVAEVHARGLHFDQHFARPAGRQGEGRETQACRDGRARGTRAATARRHRAVARAAARPRVEALHVARLAAEGDFALASSAAAVRSRAGRHPTRKPPAAGRCRGRRSSGTRSG